MGRQVQRKAIAAPRRLAGARRPSLRSGPRNAVIATGKSQKALDAEAAGSRVADSLSGRPLALSCLSGRPPLYLTAQALYECPRAPPSPSPSRHLGARDSDQNFTERLPAGTAADEISSRQHTARSTQKAQASSGPPMRSSWSSFCPTITRTAPRRAGRGGERARVWWCFESNGE